MKKSHLKLIMELIFIFILPLLFICFTSEIQIEREFTYDNEGNYQVSEDTKKLSFDNSIIKYKKDNAYLRKFENKTYNQSIWIPINLDNYGVYDNNIVYLYNNDNQIYIYWTTDTELLIYSNSNLRNIISYNKVSIKTIKGIIYYEYNINFDTNIEENNILYDYGYYDILNENTIWGNIKELLINNLDLNNNVLLDIVLCYTTLWLVMFLIWHLIYGFLELIFHIIPKRWERDFE